MKTYLVFEPADGGRDAAAADRVVFLREKFRWLALLFGPLWLLWNRLWLPFFLWLIASLVLAAAAYLAGLNEEATAMLLWLPTLIVAFEGTQLLRRKLLRRHRETGVVVAHDIEDAERRYFADWEGSPSAVPAKPPVAPPPSMPSSSSNPVIGLFPEPGGRR